MEKIIELLSSEFKDLDREKIIILANMISFCEDNLYAIEDIKFSMVKCYKQVELDDDVIEKHLNEMEGIVEFIEPNRYKLTDEFKVRFNQLV